MTEIYRAFLKGSLLHCHRVKSNPAIYICLQVCENGQEWLVSHYSADRDDFYFVTYHDSYAKAHKRYTEQLIEPTEITFKEA